MLNAWMKRGELCNNALMPCATATRPKEENPCGAGKTGIAAERTPRLLVWLGSQHYFNNPRFYLESLDRTNFLTIRDDFEIINDFLKARAPTAPRAFFKDGIWLGGATVWGTGAVLPKIGLAADLAEDPVTGVQTFPSNQDTL